MIENDYKLAAQRGELEPYFQPIVDLKGGRLKALEANFMPRLERTVDDSSLQANRLHLKIPIETFELDTALAHERARSLVEIGFTVVVDHVGNTRSVDTSLSDCPISVIKLDEAFVSGATPIPQLNRPWRLGCVHIDCSGHTEKGPLCAA